jgi:hypothetical protein
MAAVMLSGIVASAAAGVTRRECLAEIASPAGVLPGVATLRCRDGDASCDLDGVADGTCTTSLRLCFLGPGCDGASVDTVRIGGALAADVAPAADALEHPIVGADACTAPVPVRVVLNGRRRRRRALRVAARGPGVRDVDRVRIVCEREGEAGRALVVTTDFETGVLATAHVAPPIRPRRIATPIHSDALVRVRGGVVAIVNRFLGDNVQILDPDHGFRTRLQCSTGPGSNPHDLAVLDAHKGYVTRYDRDTLWVIDPGATGCGGFQTGSIPLGSLADADGLPEMSQMAIVGDRLFVALQRLDRTRGFAPTGPSLLAVIDTATDTIVDSVTLVGSNAFGDASGLVLDARGRLLVAQAGDIFRTGDGGIEAVDPVTLASDGFIVTEDALGGSVTDFVLVGPHKGYAVVLGSGLRNLLVAFDPETGSSLGTVATSSSYMPDVTLAPDGQVWLATRGGVRIIDPVTDAVVRRVDFGLPPFSIGFVP